MPRTNFDQQVLAKTRQFHRGEMVPLRKKQRGIAATSPNNVDRLHPVMCSLVATAGLAGPNRLLLFFAVGAGLILDRPFEYHFEAHSISRSLERGLARCVLESARSTRKYVRTYGSIACR